MKTAKTSQKTGLLLSAVMIATSAAAANYVSTVTGLNPVGYYRLGETTPVPANIATNSGTAGAIGNGFYVNDNPLAPMHPTISGALAGDPDPAATFNGASSNPSYMQVPLDPSINPQGAFTAEAWFQPNVAPAGLTCPMAYGHIENPTWGPNRSGWLLYQDNGSSSSGSGWNFRMYNHVGVNRALTLMGGDVPVPGNWYHVAVAYDGTNGYLYVNGVQVSSGVAPGYVGSVDGNFSLGLRNDLAYAYNGMIDEVAVYTNALDPSVILAHYQNGINPSPTTPYDVLVQSSHPLLYYRLDEPAFTPPYPLPTTADLGSWGNAEDGNIEDGVTMGQPGVRYPGFEPGNLAPRFNGLKGSVAIPTPPLNTDTLTFTAWVKRRGPSEASQGAGGAGWAGIVFQRGAANATGFGFGDGNDLRYTWEGGDYTWVPSPQMVIPDGVWSFVAAVYTSTQTVLCLNGAFATNVVNHTPHDFSVDQIYIGQDPLGNRFVDGYIDEVAIFDTALTPSQLLQLYSASGMPPVITAQPQPPAGTLYEGQNVSFSVAAIGVQPLAYQWTKNSSPITGQTGTTLAMNNLHASDTGDYAVVVTNSFGSVTSSIVPLTVLAGPPILVSVPASVSRFPGGTASFSVAAQGSTPITYQWLKGADPIPGATGTTLTLTSLQASDVASYSVVATNPYGQTNSPPATLSLLPLGPNSVNALLTRGPIAFWRLNETSGTTAFDSVGGFDGAYNALTTHNGVAGPRPPSFAGLEADNTAYSFDGNTSDITCPAPNTTMTAATILAFIQPLGLPPTDLDGLVYCRGTPGNVAGLNLRPTTGNLGYNWNDNGAAYNWDSTLRPITNQWNFVALVVETHQATMYLDAGSGLTRTTNSISHLPESFAAPVHLGTDPSGNRIYHGLMDEVAIFDRAFSPAEIQAIHDGAYQNIYSPVPVAIVLQPVSQNLVVGDSCTLRAEATGSPPLAYQWLEYGTNLPGAIRSTLSFPSISLSDAGSYALVVTNDYGAVTSSVAILTVTPTSLSRAVGYPAYNAANRTASLTQVLLEFSAPIDPAAISNLANFAVSDGVHSLNITAAAMTNLNQMVVLTTSPQTQGTNYTVTINNIVDRVGNTVPNSSPQFRGWVASPANGVFWEYWACENAGNSANTAVASLTGDDRFPDHATMATNLWGWDTRIVFPDNSYDNYGTRMRGLFVPPISGNWVFFMRSDDASQGYLNPSGPDPAGKVLIMQETGCCEDWNAVHSAPIPLVAGQPYYLETLHKEGGGDDYCKVAARLDGTGTPPLGTANIVIDPASLAGPVICYPYAPADAGGPLTVTGPDSVSVAANRGVTFAVQASNPVGQPMFYQWYRNGALIMDATNSAYSLLAGVGDNGAQYTAHVWKLGSVVVSAPAVLTVTADTIPPAVAAIHGSNELTTVIVSFSALMSPSQSAGSYTLPGFNVTGAVLDWTGTNVVLTLDKPLTPNQGYSLTVQNVTDSAGNTLASATAPFQSFFFSRGLLRFDYFGGLSTSVNTLDTTLLVDPRWPNSPDTTYFVTGFDSRTVFPDDVHAGYGDHISGLFVPPVSGNYVFYLRSDDTSRLFMNPNGSGPAGSTAGAFYSVMDSLCGEAACCPGFSAHPSLTTIALVGGQMYFIESIHKEGGGGDYVQVAVDLDTSTNNPDGLRPIAPALVGLLADPVGASVTITQQPASAVGVYVGAPLNADFDANDGGFTVANYGWPVGPWSYNWAAGSWTNFGPANCGGPFGSGLRSPVLTVRSSDPVVLTFGHRYSFEYDSSAAYDGGQVRLSVNGGPFATVPPESFTANGYIGPIGGSIAASITGTAGWTNMAFVRESAGYGTRTLLTSVAVLGSFSPGDTIQLEFVASWDECSEGTEPNWEIDSVVVTGGGAVLGAKPSLTVGAESTYQGQPNRFMSYFWQQDTGAGFTDISGANSPTLELQVGLADSGTRYRCIVYCPGACSTSEVATVTVALPITLARPTPTTITLTWPLPPPPWTATTLTLEQTPSLAPATWTPVTGVTYQSTASSVYVTLPIAQSGPGMFYRLRKN
ncbi:MAG: LamG-like jellyroll fold domain-containing protein [Verrucomicrobiota bacterium]|jgi:hypothetical protein